VSFVVSVFRSDQDNRPRGQVFDSFADFLEALGEHEPREYKSAKDAIEAGKPRDYAAEAFSPVSYFPRATRGKEGVATVNGWVLDLDHATEEKIVDAIETLEREDLEFVLYDTHSSTREARRVRMAGPYETQIAKEYHGAVWDYVNELTGKISDPSAREYWRIYYSPSKPLDAEPGLHEKYYHRGKPLDAVALVGAQALNQPTPPPAPALNSGTGAMPPRPALPKPDRDEILRRLRAAPSWQDPQKRLYLERALAGEAIEAEGHGRDNAVFGPGAVLTAIAGVAPELDPEDVVQLLMPSFEAMERASTNPKNPPPTREKLLSKAVEAVRNSREHAQGNDWVKPWMKRAASLTSSPAPAEGESAEVRAAVEAVFAGPAQVGDEAELARKTSAVFAAESGGVPLSFDDVLRRYDSRRGVHVQVTIPEWIQRAQRFSGHPVGGEKPQRWKISAATAKGAQEIACALPGVLTPGRFAAARLGRACANGFLTWDADSQDVVLLPHRPGHLARSAIDVPYDPSARCGRFLQFLSEIQLSEADQVTLQERLGIGVLGLAAKFQQALILHGELGANGKNTLIDAVSPLFPVDRPVSLNKLEEEHWAAWIYGADLITDSEASRELVHGEAVKKIISGDKISARNKYGQPFDFRNTALFLLPLNRLPATDDVTPSFFRRFRIIDFPRQFSESEQRTALGEQLREELPGILGWAIRGAVEVLKRGHYSPPGESHVRIMEEWERSANTVKAWFAERLEKEDIKDGGYQGLGLDELYPKYATWCDFSRLKAYGKPRFGRALNLLAPRKHAEGGNRYPVKVRDATEPSLMQRTAQANVIRMPRSRLTEDEQLKMADVAQAALASGTLSPPAA
jgi:P4 family phage/plasmid primase-like protien